MAARSEAKWTFESYVLILNLILMLMVLVSFFDVCIVPNILIFMS